MTPEEFWNLPIPYKDITLKQFHIFQKEFANSESIEQILSQNDSLLLANFGLTPSNLERLKGIRQKLISRRLLKDKNNWDYSGKVQIMKCMAKKPCRLNQNFLS